MKPLPLLLGCILIAMVALPFLPLLLWSVSEQWFYPAVFPQQFGLRGWHYILTTARPQLIQGLLHSTVVATATTCCSLLLGLPAARALGLYTFRAKKLVGLLLLLPVIVPPLCVAMGLHMWFIRLGLAETFAGVVAAHLTFCLPYTIFVLWGVFTDFNPEIEQQARSLGATPIQVLLHVTLPMIVPGMGIAALFAFLLSWSQYLSTLIIGGGRLLTLPILLFALMDSGDRPVAAAVSLVFVLPALLALLASAHLVGKKGVAGVR